MPVFLSNFVSFASIPSSDFNLFLLLGVKAVTVSFCSMFIQEGWSYENGPGTNYVNHDGDNDGDNDSLLGIGSL